MTTTQSDMLQITLSIMMLVFCSYAGGRVHQWYRHGVERDTAFREGYNHASSSLFPLATRYLPTKTTPPPARLGQADHGPDAARTNDLDAHTRVLQLDHGRHASF